MLCGSPSKQMDIFYGERLRRITRLWRQQCHSSEQDQSQPIQDLHTIWMTIISIRGQWVTSSHSNNSFWLDCQASLQRLNAISMITWMLFFWKRLQRLPEIHLQRNGERLSSTGVTSNRKNSNERNEYRANRNVHKAQPYRNWIYFNEMLLIVLYLNILRVRVHLHASEQEQNLYLCHWDVQICRLRHNWNL